MESGEARRVVRSCSRSTQSAAWENLVVRFGAKIRAGVVNGLVRSGIRPRKEMVDDLAQDVYCKLLADGRRALRACCEASPQSIGAYLRRTAERVALDFARARGAVKRGGDLLVSLQETVDCRGDRALPVTPPTAEHRLLVEEEKKEFLGRCRSVVRGRHPQRDYKVLQLAYVEGLSSREIAGCIGLSTNGVDSILYRSRQRLAEQGIVVPSRGALGGIG